MPSRSPRRHAGELVLGARLVDVPVEPTTVALAQKHPGASRRSRSPASSSCASASASAPRRAATTASSNRSLTGAASFDLRSESSRAALRAPSMSPVPSRASASPASRQSRSSGPFPRPSPAPRATGPRWPRICPPARNHQPSRSFPVSSRGCGPAVTKRPSSAVARSYCPARPRVSPYQKATSRASAGGRGRAMVSLHAFAPPRIGPTRTRPSRARRARRRPAGWSGRAARSRVNASRARAGSPSRRAVQPLPAAPRDRGRRALPSGQPGRTRDPQARAGPSRQ